MTRGPAGLPARCILLAAFVATATGQRLHAIRIDAGSVFAPAEAKGFVPRLVNAAHWTTRDDVIAREIWLHPGDVVTAEKAAEVARHLRSLGQFAEVAVTIEPAPPPADGEVDLVVRTRDRFSLFLSGGASYVGGVTGFNVAVGEKNLLGLGDSVAGSFRRSSDGRFRGTIGYTDLHVLDSWVTGSVRLNRTDDGDGAGLVLDRPIKHLEDPFGWRTEAVHDEFATDYYRAGSIRDSVPQRRALLGGSTTWVSGPRDERRSVGLVAELEQHAFGAATGSLAPELRVPGDTSSVFAGATFGLQVVAEYLEVDGIDTLGYVQDLALGLGLGATLGLRVRDEAGVATQLEPELRGDLAWTGRSLADVLHVLQVSGGARLHGDAAVGWNTTARTQTFARLGERHVLALSGVVDAVHEEQDLTVEMTLGEDNGLRGYDARILDGTRRVRLNVEERFATGIEFWTFRVGLSAFADVGWIGRGGLDGPFRAAGGGLRIGSPPLLGSGVLRIDAAWPFDTVVGDAGGWSVSFAIGQVFTFGGNASALGAR